MSALTEGQRLGAYRIVRLLGEGGMGAVYEARQEPLDRRVALKVLHPEFATRKDALGRFFNEAKVLSRLEHPSIVQVSDFGTREDGTAFLVMEYLRGQSLGSKLRELAERRERLPIATVVQIAFQVADVLAVAHAQNIVHRDLKPENLMLVADPIAPGGERVKLLDFGIAKLTDEREKGGVKTATQQVLGTPAYMSPEQCAGKGGVDAQTDVYALGCVLFEMLAGRTPFVSEGAGELLALHLYQEPPALLSLAPHVPAALAGLVHRLIHKQKSLRPTMDEVADELLRQLSRLSGGGQVVRSRLHNAADANKISKATPFQSTLGRSVGESNPTSSRSRWILGTAGVIAIGVCALILNSRMHDPRPSPTPVPIPSAQSPSTAVKVAPKISEHEIIAPPASEEPRRSAQIRWRLTSVPMGCSVLDDKGQSLGTTPLDLPRTAAEGILRVRVHKPGYMAELLDLRMDHDEKQEIILKEDKRRTARATALPSKPATQTTIHPVPSERKRIGYED